jgi:hypothetical protein
MDPITAIGLAGTIVQFIDFGSKLVTSTCEIYNSAQDTSKNHQHLDTITATLSGLCAGLSPANRSTSINSTASVEALSRLSHYCQKDAEALLQVLNELKVKGRKSKLGSFQQALRGVWNDGTIRTLERRLESYRSELGLQLVALFR